MQIRPRESDLSNEDQDETNEIVAATRAVKEQRDAADAANVKTTKANHWPLATIGLGIGSAAVVAALLFARNRKKDG